MPNQTPRPIKASISALEDTLGQLEDVDPDYLDAAALDLAVRAVEELASTAIESEAEDNDDSDSDDDEDEG